MKKWMVRAGSLAGGVVLVHFIRKYQKSKFTAVRHS